MRLARLCGKGPVVLSMPNSLAKFGVMNLMAGAALFAPGLVQAQQSSVPQTSHPVVQTVPGDKGMRLNAALNRLGRNPQDAEALIEAGEASLELGDIQAAIGFYQRASTFVPGSPRVKAGLASAYVLNQDPFTAIPLFEEAARAGSLGAIRLADRGLAHDLVGDNQTAQGFYRQSLAAAPSDEALRRLSISQAIAGDRKAMEVTLSPLLQSQNKAAWRTRAFGLAILGNPEEAESIARQSMPVAMANSMTAYLRYMPKLTAAQQAAAAIMGNFPRAAQIGQDDPRIAQYARPKAGLAAATPAATLARADTGRRGSKPAQPVRRAGSDRALAGVPPPAVSASIRPEPRAAPPPEPKVERKVDAAPVQLASAGAPEPVRTTPANQEAELPPVPDAVKATPPPAPQPVPAPVQPAQTATANPGFSSFDLAKSAGAESKPPAAIPAPAAAALSVPVAAPTPAKPRPSLDDAFADLSRPSLEIEPKAGAVDLRKLKPTVPAAKDKPKSAAELAKEAVKDKGKAAKVPPPPSHPSRIWVQVATGRAKKALAFDWNKMVKADPAVFKARKGYTSAWGQTNRLLTGPFETEAAANAYISQLKKAGVGGAFLWTSPAGQIVDALPAGK